MQGSAARACTRAYMHIQVHTHAHVMEEFILSLNSPSVRLLSQSFRYVCAVFIHSVIPFRYRDTEKTQRDKGRETQRERGQVRGREGEVDGGAGIGCPNAATCVTCGHAFTGSSCYMFAALPNAKDHSPATLTDACMMHVFVYVCMYRCMYVRMRVCTLADVYESSCRRTYVHPQLCFFSAVGKSGSRRFSLLRGRIWSCAVGAEMQDSSTVCFCNSQS